MTLPVQVGTLGSSWEVLWPQRDRELGRKRGLNSAGLLRDGTLVTLPKSEGRALVEICAVVLGKGQEGGQSAPQRGMWACLNARRGPGKGPLKK